MNETISRLRGDGVSTRIKDVNIKRKHDINRSRLTKYPYNSKTSTLTRGRWQKTKLSFS